MGKIKLNHPYTRAEMAEMRDDPALTDLKLKGYVLRLEGDTFTFVHWSQASGGAEFGTMRQPRTYQAPMDQLFPKDEIPAIVKRTPQQRVDSLMLKVIEDMKAGAVLTPEQIGEIVGEAKRSGRDEITGEVVKQVAQHFLEQSEKEKAEHDSHYVTTPYD